MDASDANQVERLVEQIRVEGNYASPSEALAAALQLVQQAQLEESRRQAAARPKTKRHKWALAVFTFHVTATFAAAVISAMEVGSIVVTGPVLTFTGLGLALLARPLVSWRVLGYSISTPLICALCAALIAINSWGPREAQVPITIVLFVSAIGSVPVAILAFRELQRWSEARGSWPPFPWQYSLKSLLVLTTAVCVVVAVLRLLFANVSRADFIIFSLFFLVTLCLVGFTVYAFVASPRRQ